ncbi:MAG: hypothetical protein ACR2KW_06020 [Rubrobacter sp.]
MAFIFIFVVVRGCVAKQESTQIRKYVTSSDSIISDSSAAGNEQLQPALADAGGEVQNVDAEVVNQVANQSELLYNRALDNEEVPPEFSGANSYLVSALGVRADATRDVANSLQSPDTFQETLADATESYRLSDGILRNHYFPVVSGTLESVGQVQDQSFIEEPPPFMDYEETGFDVGSENAVGTRNDPNALHGVEITSVTAADQQLYSGGEIVLTGDDVPSFNVTITNGGEVPETAVPVEVIINTSAERQAQTATIERIEGNGGTATVEVSGFRPGEVNETAEITVETGPVQYEELTDNNTLTGLITFGV